MSCNFPDPSVALALPEIDFPPEPPAIPFTPPNYSIDLAELGLKGPSLEAGLQLSIPEVDFPPEPPAIPFAPPNYALDLQELGLKGPSLDASLALSLPQIDFPPEAPVLPTFQVPPCPFDEAA